MEINPDPTVLAVTNMPGWMKRNTSYLVNEGRKFVVEGFDLVLLLLTHSLHVGVNLQVKRCQEVLVDCDPLNTSRAASSSKSKPSSTSPVSKPTVT